MHLDISWLSSYTLNGSFLSFWPFTGSFKSICSIISLIRYLSKSLPNLDDNYKMSNESESYNFYFILCLVECLFVCDLVQYELDLPNNCLCRRKMDGPVETWILSDRPTVLWYLALWNRLSLLWAGSWKFLLHVKTWLESWLVWMICGNLLLKLILYRSHLYLDILISKSSISSR